MEEFSDIPNSSNNLRFGLSAFRVENRRENHNDD